MKLSRLIQLIIVHLSRSIFCFGGAFLFQSAAQDSFSPLMTRKRSSEVEAKTNGTNCFSRQRKIKPQFWVVVILFSGWNVSNACYDAILQSSSDERGCSCCRVCRWPSAGSSASVLRRSRGSISPDSSPGSDRASCGLWCLCISVRLPILLSEARWWFN